MNNYKIVNTTLLNIEYEFNRFEKEKLQLSLADSIKVVGVVDNQSILIIERELSFNKDTDSKVKVRYEVVLESDGITEETLLADLKNDIVSLASVYAKISLLISEITNLSPFGTLVTTPYYNSQTANIE